MNLEIYPKSYSKQRPFFVEIQEENGVKSIRVFKANYMFDTTPWNETGEAHPWNLDVYTDLIDTDKYPAAITFWKEDFVKWVIDAMNDKYEKEYIN